MKESKSLIIDIIAKNIKTAVLIIAEMLLHVIRKVCIGDFSNCYSPPPPFSILALPLAFNEVKIKKI